MEHRAPKCGMRPGEVCSALHGPGFRNVKTDGIHSNPPNAISDAIRIKAQRLLSFFDPFEDLYGTRGSSTRNPIGRLLVSGGFISSRIASKTTLNWVSYFFSRASSLRAKTALDASILRRRTKARMIRY